MSARFPEAINRTLTTTSTYFCIWLLGYATATRRIDDAVGECLRMVNINSPWKTNGSAYLRLHEATLIDEDFGYQPNTEITQDVYLKAGYHAVKLNYLLKSGNSPQLKLKWKSEEGNWAIVDGKVLFHL